MRTNEFPYYSPPFYEYNVAQRAAVPFLDQDVNLVISFATAAGKTVLAECCFGYHLTTDEECRVAYVCPFKSLASEKNEDWQANRQLSRHGIVLGTGDTTASADEYDAARLAILTCESFDSKTRSRSYRSWMKTLACVVVDEAHLMNDPSRGGAIEASLMRLSSVNPSARIVLLSATMDNAKELASWIKFLNGKATKCVESSWRPTKVILDYCVIEGYDQKVEETVRLAVESSHVKTIVFVHSKPTGNQILKEIRKAGVRSAFHNASVSPRIRRKIEKTFNDPMSGMNVIVSTATLGSGVNMG